MLIKLRYNVTIAKPLALQISNQLGPIWVAVSLFGNHLGKFRLVTTAAASERIINYISWHALLA